MVQDGTQEFFVSLGPGTDDIFFPTQQSQQFFSNTVADIADSFGQPAFDAIVQFFQGGGTPQDFTDFIVNQGYASFTETGIQVLPGGNQSGFGEGDTTATVLDPQAAGGNDVNVDDLTPTSVLGDFFSAANRLGGIGALSPDLLDAAIRAGSALIDLNIGDFDLTRPTGPPVPADAAADAVTEAGMNLLQTFQSDSEGEAVASSGPNDGPS